MSGVTITDFFFPSLTCIFLCEPSRKKTPLALCLKTHYSAWRKHILFKPHLICIYKEWWLLSWTSNYELRRTGWDGTLWPPMSPANGCVKCSKVETGLQSQLWLCFHGDGGPQKKKKKWSACVIQRTHHCIKASST